MLTVFQVVRDKAKAAEEAERTLVREHSEVVFNAVSRRLERRQPHLESPQDRQVLHPSIITTAAVLQIPHSCAPSG